MIKITLGILFLFIVVGTFYVDYKWRRWMAARRRERGHANRHGERDP